MRGLLLFVVFVASVPLIFVSPFYGVLMWYVFSIGNLPAFTYGFFAGLNYAYVIAICTFASWLLFSSEKKAIPLTTVVVLTLLFSIWMTITSLFALAPSELVWDKWIIVHKILLMALVGYALTTTPARVSQLVWAVVLSLGFWGVRGAIIGALTGGASKLYGPGNSAIGDNNDFGLALVMILPLIFYKWQLAESRWLRHALLCLGAMVTVSVVLTYSRGALLGLGAMAAVLLVRSRARVRIALVIITLGSLVWNFAPQAWFERMNTIETYDQDASANSRLYIWKVALQIAHQRPVIGGGFKVTYWPDATNPLLAGSDVPELTRARASHSIYFETLAEHGYVGLAIFLAITIYSWFNCSRLIRQSVGRKELAWAEHLGRMGQPVLIAYWTAGAFASQTYLDEYWCMVFLFDAARRIAAKQASSAFDALSSAHLPERQARASALVPKRR